MKPSKKSNKKSSKSSMDDKTKEIIEIDESAPFPEQNSTPLKPVFCLRNRDQIRKFEGDEDCFILEFDPSDDLEVVKIYFSKDCDNAETDLCIVAEKGQVAECW